MYELDLNLIRKTYDPDIIYELDLNLRRKTYDPETTQKLNYYGHETTPTIN